MIEQKISIGLKDEYSNIIGTLKISSINYFGNSESKYNISNSIVLENIDLVSKPDNVTPIQYCTDNSQGFSNIMLLEETEYQVLFESDDINSTYNVLYSLTKINNNHFKEFRFSISDNVKYKVVGILNFRSYVGKSFLDVKKDNVNSIPISIEVRSKKIDYFNQYSAMIADLSQYALSLIFEVNSPLFQEFKISNKNKLTLYEDFMFLEYLFRYDNLPSIFEYLTKNLHSQLINHKQTKPLSLASKITNSTIKNIVSNPMKLIKSEVGGELSNGLNGYIPYEIQQINQEDSINTPENRFVKYFLEIVKGLIEELLINVKEGYIKDKLLVFLSEIEYYLSLKFFNQISEMDYIPFNSQVLQKKEGYREIFQYFLMIEFSFKLSWDELNNQFRGFEKKLSELYEYWCYFKLLKVLNDLSTTKIDFEEVFEVNKTNWSVNVIKGQKSLKKFDLNLYDHHIEVHLFYNLTFSDKSMYKSYSLAFKPDYTLLIFIGDKKHFIHFDAKYRSEFEIIDFYNKIDEKNSLEIENEITRRDNLEERRSVFKEGDIYKMHTYKDSILETEGSYVLYPGNKTKMFEVTDLLIPSVGAFSLTPGKAEIEENNLGVFIKNVIKTLLFRDGYITYEWGSL